MNNQCCSRCGVDLPEGSLKYILSIRLYADFDGAAAHDHGDGEGEPDDIEYLLGCLEKSSREEVERDVHQEMAFMLCKRCRDGFTRNPLNSQVDGEYPRERRQGILH